MKKNLSFLILSFPLLLLPIGCTPIKSTQAYPQKLEISWPEYNKLLYLLEWIIDIKNDKADTWNKPLSTDAQKWTFVFNILNNDYMNKFENPEEDIEHIEAKFYPILQSLFIPNDWDVHDWVFPIDENVKVAYKKSDIDKILKDIVWDTLKDWNKIVQDWMILSGDKYLLFTYEYYWSDLIGNKWRATRFEIDSINQTSDKDIEIKARYLDDALVDWEDLEETECNLTYHITKTPGSFYGYTVNEYMYTWCEMDKNYIAPDYPSQLIYGIYDWVYSDYVTLKRDFETREKKIDLNWDWIEEYFAIWPDSPNWTKILGINWDKWYNFIYDFTHEIVDDYNEILDWLFVEMYFKDLDWWDDLEIIVAVGDKKNWLKANVYKLWWDEWFTRLWTINGRSYLEYDDETQTIHAPYSNNWVCKRYYIENEKFFSL